MLTIRQNVMKIQLLNLSTSAVHSRKNPLKQIRKQRQQERLERIQAANPFNTNVGMRHQLKNTDLPDPDDPALQIFDHTIDISNKLETIVSTSDIEERKMTQNLPRKAYIDKDEVRKAIVKKKYFPEPKEPQVKICLTFRQL